MYKERNRCDPRPNGSNGAPRRARVSASGTDRGRDEGRPRSVERDERRVGRGGEILRGWLPHKQNFPNNMPVAKSNSTTVVAAMPSATALRLLVSSRCRSRCVTVFTLL